jgi:hypothetical protein
MKILLSELLIFSIFFFMTQFIFSVVGNLLFHDTLSYWTLGEAMLTINNEVVVNSKEGPAWGYFFMLTYVLISFILIINLIVGQLSRAYKKYQKNRHVIFLIETLSVREAQEADEKYSAAISPPYPLSILNMILGTYILSVKNQNHNKMILHFYYFPIMVVVLSIFTCYQFLILPLCYIKTVGHKFALIIKNP